LQKSFFVQIKKMMKTKLILGIVLLLSVLSLQAQENANTRQARKVFDEAYEKVFGAQGASLHYKVNVANLYKTEGTIWYKGKKSKYLSKSSKSWNDGVTAYVVKDDKKRVEIYKGDDPKQSRFGDDFKFEPDNYTYHIANDPRGYLITLNVKKGMKGMKEIRALLDKKTRDPLQLRIKVAFIWANVDISNFRSGGITDATFTFPRSEFKNYEFVDKRD
jgi:outer membrane lipoprotein-sorting protein